MAGRRLRTAIYMRISTQEQSVESQRHELLQFVENRPDLKLVGEYQDTISGVKERRKQLDLLMTAAKQRKIDAVVFFDFSRVTRKGISHAIGLLDEWKQAGVKPICYSFPSLDFTDASGAGQVIACLLAWVANQEREMLRKRIAAGMKKAKATGTKSGNPIGRPKISATKQSKIRDLRHDGVSYGEISRQLKLAKSVVFKYANA